jgi:hypothetical protein
MIIASKNDNQFILAHYQDMFPHVSFSTNGPNDNWLTDNQCYKVSMTKEFDPQTQELVPSEPYLEDGIVYTVPVSNTAPVSNSVSNTVSG